jgi:Ca-activated chloride channel family protein
VVVTDGYVDVEKEAFELIRTNSGNTNFFSFGIGSGVNRYLIEGMAFMGNGEPMIITEQKEAEKQAEQFRNYINTPVLTQIKTNYGSFQAYDVEPPAAPDMLAERPIIIFGKYKGKPTGTVTLSGKSGRKSYKQSFNLSSIQANPAYSALRYLWARERIKYLDYLTSNDYSYSKDDDTVAKKITELGLKYNLMTNYTSFIAIDELQVMQDGKLVTVKQALPLPEGVSDYAVGYEMDEIRNRPSFTVNMASISADMQVMEIPDIEERPAIFSHVEVPPAFPGGEAALMKFIADNIAYPSEAIANGYTGRVVVRFVVNEDGSITDVEIQRGVNPILNKEALRVVKSMPKWLPGKQNGRPVRVYYTLPIVFDLQK